MKYKCLNLNILYFKINWLIVCLSRLEGHFITATRLHKVGEYIHINITLAKNANQFQLQYQLWVKAKQSQFANH